MIATGGQPQLCNKRNPVQQPRPSTAKNKQMKSLKKKKKPTHNKTKNLIIKIQAKYLNRHFIIKDLQMLNKHKK